VRIWSFIGQKGGIGKSLLSTQLAVYGSDIGVKVVILDLDPQLYSVTWHRIRGSGVSPGVTDVQPNKLGAVIEGLRNSGVVDLLFLDTPSRADKQMIAAIASSDLVICPTLPVGPDMDKLLTTVNVIKAADAAGRTIGVVNRVFAQGATKAYADASVIIERFGIRVAGTYLCERAAYRQAMTLGKGVTEMTKAKEAKDEIISLWSELTETPPIVAPAMTEEERS
jgi:chromosome partitioning protein